MKSFHYLYSDVEKVFLGHCNGQYCESTWLGYSTQLFNRVLIVLLLWRYFVAVIKVSNLLIDDLDGPESISFKWFRRRAEASLTNKSHLWTATCTHTVSSLPFLKGYEFQTCLASPHNHISQLLEISVFMSPTGSAFLAK